MRLQRTVTIDRPLDKVFGYLSDFTTTTQWDPGTVETFRTSGGAPEGTYTADFTFKGLARFVAHLLGPAFTRLGNAA